MRKGLTLNRRYLFNRAWIFSLLLVCLGGCVSKDLDLLSFHDTERYTFIPKDMDGDSKIDYIQRFDKTKGWKNAFYRDADGDGLFEKTIDFDKACIRRWPHIVFAVDGFPFSHLQALREEGYFRLFRSTGSLIAPFPSLTGVSWPKILGLDLPEGYEAIYFNQAENKIMKTTGGHVFNQDNEIISSLQHARAYVQVKAYAKNEIKDRYREALTGRQDRKDRFFYFLGTDSAGHRARDEDFREILIEIDDLIEKIFYAYGCRLRLSIVSDHGNTRIPGTYVDVIGPLKAAGYDHDDKINSDDDFVIPRYGMIGVAPIYTAYQNVKPMATILSRLEGIDFVIYWSPRGVHVISSQGEALVKWRQQPFRFYPLRWLSRWISRTEEFLYSPTTADPLNLKPLMQQSPYLAEDLFIKEEIWFQATYDHQYPDPLRRLVDTYRNNTKNPATLLVNFKDGYYSAGAVRHVAVTHGTHGSLSAAASLGVIGTNWCDVQSAVKAGDVNGQYGIYKKKNKSGQ